MALSAAQKRCLQLLETPGANAYAYQQWGHVLYTITGKNDETYGKVSLDTLKELESAGLVEFARDSYGPTYVITRLGRKTIEPSEYPEEV